MCVPVPRTSAPRHARRRSDDHPSVDPLANANIVDVSTRSSGARRSRGPRGTCRSMWGGRRAHRCGSRSTTSSSRSSRSRSSCPPIFSSCAMRSTLFPRSPSRVDRRTFCSCGRWGSRSTFTCSGCAGDRLCRRRRDRRREHRAADGEGERLDAGDPWHAPDRPAGHHRHDRPARRRASCPPSRAARPDGSSPEFGVTVAVSVLLAWSAPTRPHALVAARASRRSTRSPMGG